MSLLLEVRNLSLAFGGLRAVTDFSLALEPRALHGLIGPNGAGKTTVFNLLTGVYRADSGAIRLGARALDRLKPNQIAEAGVARTFQNIRLFGELSVLDNVKIGCHVRSRTGMLAAILRSGKHAAEERAMTARAHELLALFGLADRAGEQARTLPYGAQRRLEIARALATEPRLLLLDEPAAGMNSAEKRELRELIERLRHEFGLTILLIEHDMALVMTLCERLTVLDHGVSIASGSPGEVQADPAVVEAYLGEPLEKAIAPGAP